MDNGRFGLTDHDFWTEPRKSSQKLIDSLIDAEEEALVLDVPREASLDNRSTLPFGTLYVRSLNEAGQLDPERALILSTIARCSAQPRRMAWWMV